MSAYGETHRMAVAPVGDFVAALVLAASRGVLRGARAIGSVGRLIERRRVIAELASFDDHMLRDIGLTRADLRDAASTTFPVDPTRTLVLRATERRAAARLASRKSGRAV